MDSVTERRLIDEATARLQAGSTTIADDVFTMPAATYVVKARQEREPVAGWHDDRNPRRRGGYGVADAQDRPAGDRLDLPRAADAAKML